MTVLKELEEGVPMPGGGQGPVEFHREEGSMSELARVALIQDAAGFRTHVNSRECRPQGAADAGPR